MATKQSSGQWIQDQVLGTKCINSSINLTFVGILLAGPAFLDPSSVLPEYYNYHSIDLPETEETASEMQTRYLEVHIAFVTQVIDVIEQQNANWLTSPQDVMLEIVRLATQHVIKQQQQPNDLKKKKTVLNRLAINPQVNASAFLQRFFSWFNSFVLSFVTESTAQLQVSQRRRQSDVWRS